MREMHVCYIILKIRSLFHHVHIPFSISPFVKERENRAPRGRNTLSQIGYEVQCGKLVRFVLLQFQTLTAVRGNRM